MLAQYRLINHHTGESYITQRSCDQEEYARYVALNLPVFDLVSSHEGGGGGLTSGCKGNEGVGGEKIRDEGEAKKDCRGV